MQVENWIVTRLLADEAVKALVGDRVYPVTITQGQPTPAIVYRRTFTRRGESMRGPDGQPRVGFRVQAFVKGRWGEREAYNRAKQVMEAVRPLFNSIRETPARPPVSKFYVAHCRIDNEADAHEQGAEGSEDLYYAPFLDLEIDHTE